jgi:mannose-6-phosphate isomerase-like protein (cupin superfamily)
MPDGSVYIVTTPTAETNGEYVEMEFVLPADCVAPPPHTHPSQVEEYEVIEGSFEVMVDGEWSTIGPGQSASVPVGVIHTFRNPTDGPIRVRNWHRPALRFENFIEEVCTALNEAGIKGNRDPRVPIYLSTFFFKYSDTLGVPRRRERFPMRAMAGVGRVLGVGRS